MRPCLTIALLLLASMGAQGGSANMRSGDSVTPRLLAALMEQPAGIFASSPLKVPPAGNLLLRQLTAAPGAACPDSIPVAEPNLPGAVARAESTVLRDDPGCAPRATRGP